MTKKDKDELKNEDIIEDMQSEIEEIENEEWEIVEEKLEEAINPSDSEVDKLKDLLARNQADFDNFKKRTQRDKEDMIFFLKSDILKKILPRIDDIERIITNTPKELQVGWLYEWILAMEKALKKDLDWFWVSSFDSIWKEVDPNKHDVMTKIPWKEGIIVDEFEKWYLLNGRVMRHAKVVVWSWE